MTELTELSRTSAEQRYERIAAILDAARSRV